MLKIIKPCPFCHRKMKVDYKLFPLRYAIVHVSKFYFDDMCYGGTGYEYETENEAIEAWNRRVSERMKGDSENDKR